MRGASSKAAARVPRSSCRGSPRSPTGLWQHAHVVGRSPREQFRFLLLVAGLFVGAAGVIGGFTQDPHQFGIAYQWAFVVGTLALGLIGAMWAPQGVGAFAVFVWPGFLIGGVVLLLRDWPSGLVMLTWGVVIFLVYRFALSRIP